MNQDNDNETNRLLNDALSDPDIGTESVAIGTDLVSISRVKTALRTKGFKQRIFSTREIDYCESKRKPEQHYAARWAAKEATIKAIPSADNNSLEDITVCQGPCGPNLAFEGRSEPKVAKVSLAHDTRLDAALAFVILIF